MVKKKTNKQTTLEGNSLKLETKKRLYKCEICGNSYFRSKGILSLKGFFCKKCLNR